MKVKCINNDGYYSLTKNKIYEVIRENTDFYYILNKNKVTEEYFKYRFEIVKEVEENKRKTISCAFISFFILNQFSRDELRKYAKSLNVKRGKDKSNTIRNLIFSEKAYVNISLGEK